VSQATQAIVGHQIRELQRWRANNPSQSVVLISGGFDPPHTGHCHLILGASCHGAVIVALNSDDWLIRKKGYRLMPFEDRANVMLSFKNVADVIPVLDSDGTVCAALRGVRPTYFANGADRHQRQQCSEFSAEHVLCQELGITELFGVGGTMKMGSSSELVEDLLKEIRQSL
jgi:D-beta-D-heptose 7-phosphate kinase/D-beta-D-heptose 1-phosphate adenosyltransferase